jgi:hypothetical protein
MPIKTAIITVMFLMLTPVSFADVYINVMAVNGGAERKEMPVKFNLPGDLKSDDILDTAGLQLEYNVNDGNYFVYGIVNLDTKESKTFRIRLKDIWKISPAQLEDIKSQIDKGYEQIGKLADPAKAALLKEQLLKKLAYLQEQGVKADTVEKRIDAYRAYAKELQRLKSDALAVDFWRSQPGEERDKLIRLKIEVENPESNPSKAVRHKHYLPQEVKPEHVVEAEGFEVRYDQAKNQPFLFKEEEITPGTKKSYSVGIKNIWSIPQRELDYLKSRADYTIDFLKSSKFAQSAQLLYDHALGLLKNIQESQGVKREIKEHISAYRANKEFFGDADKDVQNLEQLLMIYREELEKSKVKNVLSKIKSFDGVAGIANQMFEKKPTAEKTWGFIGWILLFLGGITAAYFVFLMIRGGGKTAAPSDEQKKAQEKK